VTSILKRGVAILWRGTAALRQGTAILWRGTAALWPSMGTAALLPSTGYSGPLAFDRGQGRKPSFGGGKPPFGVDLGEVAYFLGRPMGLSGYS